MKNDVMHANAVSERRKSFRKFDFFSLAVWTNVKRKKAPDNETKNHSRTSPEIQVKEMNKKLRSTQPDQQINWKMPAKTQTKLSQKIVKLKQSNKQNKKYPLLKPVKPLLQRQNLILLNISISKICSKPNFVSENRPVFYLQDLKEISLPLKID